MSCWKGSKFVYFFSLAIKWRSLSWLSCMEGLSGVLKSQRALSVQCSIMLLQLWPGRAACPNFCSLALLFVNVFTVLPLVSAKKPGVAWTGGLPKHCILEVTMGHLSQHQWIQAVCQDLRCFTSWKGDIHEKLPKTRKWEMWRKGQILQYPFENSTNFVLNDLNGFWTGSRNFLCWPRRQRIPWIRKSRNQMCKKRFS